jgi:hypothetical protein
MRGNLKHLFPHGAELLSESEVNKHLEETMLMVISGLKAHLKADKS